MNEHAYIKQQALTLGIGESTRQSRCPHCGIGSGSFSISRTSDGLLFNCFRASCGYRGFISSIPSEFHEKSAARTKLKVFTHDTELLTDDHYRFFERKFGLSAHLIDSYNVRWCPVREAFVLPLVGFNGYVVGHATRWYPELSTRPYDGPKSIIYPESVTEPIVHVVSGSSAVTNQVVIVEDWVSAVKLGSFGHSCVALLGSWMDEATAMQLKGKNVLIALDPDALGKAEGIRNKYHLLFNWSEVVQLPRDPKDMTRKELDEYGLIL